MSPDLSWGISFRKFNVPFGKDPQLLAVKIEKVENRSKLVFWQKHGSLLGKLWEKQGSLLGMLWGKLGSLLGMLWEKQGILLRVL